MNHDVELALDKDGGGLVLQQSNNNGEDVWDSTPFCKLKKDADSIVFELNLQDKKQH